MYLYWLIHCKRLAKCTCQSLVKMIKLFPNFNEEIVIRKTRSLEQLANKIKQQISYLTITDYCQQNALQKQLFIPQEVSLMPHQAARWR